MVGLVGLVNAKTHCYYQPRLEYVGSLSLPNGLNVLKGKVGWAKPYIPKCLLRWHKVIPGRVQDYIITLMRISPATASPPQDGEESHK